MNFTMSSIPALVAILKDCSGPQARHALRTHIPKKLVCPL